MRLIFIIFIFLICSSCRRTDEAPEIPFPISKEMWGFLFDTHSYWIYRDSATGSTDSTFIESAVLENKTYGSSASYVRIRQYNMSFANFFGTSTKNILVARGGLWTEYFFGPFFQKWPDYGIGSKYHFRPGGHKDSIDIGGTVYRDVYISEVDSVADSNPASGITFDRYYFKDSVGILRHEWHQNSLLRKCENLLRSSVTIYPVD